VEQALLEARHEVVGADGQRASTISTMKIPVVSKVPEARASMKPSPYCAASISPTTEAVSARAMEILSPEKIHGTQEGRTTRRVTKRGGAPMVLTALTRSWSTFWTPTYVLISRMKNTIEMASMILDGMPMPNHMMNSGASATRGSA